ncbi:ASCH domain-containing protein [Thermococcus waiotapuensis]|uniref:ASCH domain-containing protein n=1 Tax=Thermococcus waiotapuensis TaxID=90909 RepID=A0AAE4T2S2_9EURY|nr:ASCH domain-containing protein [Thermococcus waiotapuensis]MDV3103026.1 ASCH domain-containing protein [Thermococcus waiotapuensis]
MEHVIALHQVYAELIFRGLKTVEIRKSRAFQGGDLVFLYVARGNPYELRDTLRRLGLHEEQTLTKKGTIAGGFEVGEVIKADLDTLWEMTKETSGLTLVHGENGKKWLGEYIKDYGYAFTIERPFLFREPVNREEMRERYGIHVEGIIHLSRRTRKGWVKNLIEDLLTREVVYL